MIDNLQGLDGQQASMSNLAGLIERAGVAAASRPVEHWNPAKYGELEMTIRRDGTWNYQGSPIGRDRMVRLFASVLRREADGRFVLVTPVERLGITVEDAPFLAVEMAVDGVDDGQCLTVRTNVGDVIEIDSDHPIRFELEAKSQGLKPYVTVRGRLEALFGRAIMYELVDLAVTHEGRMGVWSSGTFFPLPAATT